MGVLGEAGRRIVESLEQRAGRQLVPRDRVEVLESIESDNRVLRKTLDFIGFTLFNYAPGTAPTPYRMPTDMLPQARIFAAGQALRAWIDDPMAGQQVDLYVSFLLGRGVPRPQAHDDDVQDVLDQTWDDAANQRVLTRFDKLSEKAVDLAIQASVFFTFFDGGMDGRVRVSLKKFEDVLDVVRHPLDTYRILYYKCSERPVYYNFNTDSYEPLPGASGRPQIVYYEAYDAFDDDDPVKVAQDNAADLSRVTPPAARLRPGKIVPLTVNKTSEMAFGIPRMRRLLRWFTAYNEVLESHVNRMKAMASIYMTQTAHGANQRDFDRLAEMATNAGTGRRSAFGGAQDVTDGQRPPTPPRGPAGPGMTGILQQNESLQWSPFKIDSGASDVAASVPQLRSQASGMFPPTYYGQESGSLAGDQSLELPVLKFIERDQEQFNLLLRTLAQAAIDEAVRVGDLTEWRAPTEEELDRIEASEKEGTPLDGLEYDSQTGQVKRDLGFDVSLPSPLKRAMSDLVSAAVTIATAVDPMGQNVELSRWLFGFVLAEAFDVSDPQRIVDQVLPRHLAEETADQYTAPDEAGGPRAGGAAAGGATSTGPDGQQHSADNPYGAKVNSPNPEARPVQEARQSRGLRRLAIGTASGREKLVDDEFAGVLDAASAQLDALGSVPELAGSVNGNGGGPDV